MNAASVNNTANYVLQDSSGNTYHLSNPQYTSGLSATIAITNGPLQPGNYTLTISGLTDRIGNTQNPFSLQFSVAGVPGFTNQGRSSDNSATPTALTLTGDPAGTGLFVAGGRGALLNNSDVDYWTFSGTSGKLADHRHPEPEQSRVSGLKYVVTNPDGSTTDQLLHRQLRQCRERAGRLAPDRHVHGVGPERFGYSGEYRFRISDADAAVATGPGAQQHASAPPTSSR